VNIPLSGARPGAILPVSGRSATSSRGCPSDIVVIPRKGLQFPQQLSFDRWLSVGRQLSAIYMSTAWCLGDWLVYGERAYAGRYRDAIEQTSLDYQTLRNYAWVVKRFSFSRRRDTLSFGHHAEVAALPEVEQDYWLRKAEELGWSAKRLRLEVRTSLGERSANDRPVDGLPSRPPRSMVRLTIHLTPQQWRACRTVADGAGLTVQAWASLALDQAARQWAEVDLRRCAYG
jgi:hypothetical protein